MIGWLEAAVVVVALLAALVALRLQRGMSCDPLPWLVRAGDAYKAWLADLNRESFGNVVTQVLWFYGSIVLTNTAATLMLDEGAKSESHHNWGFQIITALLIGWGVKTGAGVLADRQKQKTNVPFIEAQERGKATGAVAAATLAKHVEEARRADTRPEGEPRA